MHPRKCMVMRVVYISAATDYVYLTVRHLISQREITVKTFFLISFFVNDSKRTVFINEGDYIDEKGVLQKKLKKLPRRSISQIADIDMLRLVMHPDCPGGGKGVWL